MTTIMRRTLGWNRSSRYSLDDLIEVAVRYNRGQLTLNTKEFTHLVALLEGQAKRCLDPGDKIRLDGVTLLKHSDGTAAVNMQRS